MRARFARFARRLTKRFYYYSNMDLAELFTNYKLPILKETELFTTGNYKLPTDIQHLKK